MTDDASITPSDGVLLLLAIAVMMLVTCGLVSLIRVHQKDTDFEVGETDHLLGYDEVLGWLADSTGGKRLPPYSETDPYPSL